MILDRYNAFVERDPGARGGDGPLFGVTVGVKANLAVAGLAWTAGMGSRRDVIADRDARAVARLRDAGATILGTLNMHEAALGSTTDNPFYGRTLNPHDDRMTPGGSSGGSGAAVAAGLCDVALGTDTLGSVRIPAAYCGVYGLKPGAGAIPDEGLVPLDPRFDVIGLLTRDLALMDAVWPILSDMPGTNRAWRRLVILPDLGGISVEPAILAAYARTVAEIDLPHHRLMLPASLDAIRLAAFAGIGRALAAELGEAIASEDVSPALRFVIGAALTLPEDRDLLFDTCMALCEGMGDDGVLILPTTPQAAFPHTPRPPSSQPLFTGLANVAGCPALACPAGRDERGLPIGVQLVGPARSEPALLALAHRLEPVLGGSVTPRMPVQGEDMCASSACSISSQA